MSTTRPWFDELDRQIKAKVAHSFLIHGNVKDDMLYNGELLRIYDVLPKVNSLEEAGIVAFFNLALGVYFPSEQMEALFIKYAVEPVFKRSGRPGTVEEYFEGFKRNLAHVLMWFQEMLTISWGKIAEDKSLSEDDKEKLGIGKNKIAKARKNKAPFAAAVMEYQETKTPPSSIAGRPEDRVAIETFQWWAQWRKISECGNLIFHIAESLADVDQKLTSPTGGTVVIKVALPTREDWKAVLKVFEREKIIPAIRHSASGHALNFDEISKSASGLSVVELKQVFKESKAENEDLDDLSLFKKKVAILEVKLGDMATIEKPPWGWSAIGGLHLQVGFGMIWADALKRGDISRLPKGGVLLVGAPGTCKTAFVEALAHESDVPCIKLRSTLDPFVGMSERRTYLLRDVVTALAPVILFIDEFDKQFIREDSVYHGDSGVGSRSRGIWMEFLSDPTIHGKVMVVAACNRPDRLEVALKRSGRFGIKLAFLIPKKEHRPAIWRALFKKEQVRFELSGLRLDTSILEDERFIEEISEMCDFWWSEKDAVPRLLCGPLAEETNPLKTFSNPKVVRLTGGEMEEIISLSLTSHLPEKEVERLKDLSSSEREKLLAEFFAPQEKIVLRPEDVLDALRNFLPHEDIEVYEAMDDLALMTVNDLRFVPEEYRDRARSLRADKNLRRKILGALLA